MIKRLNQKVIRIEDGIILTCILTYWPHGINNNTDTQINIQTVLDNPTKYVFTTKEHISIYGRKAFTIGKIELTNTQRAMLWWRNLPIKYKREFDGDKVPTKFSTKEIEQIFNHHFNDF